MVLASMRASRQDSLLDHLMSNASESSLKLVLEDVDFLLSFVGVAFLLLWVGRTT